MTPKELYEWACREKLEDANIIIKYYFDKDIAHPELNAVKKGRYEVIIDLKVEFETVF